MFHCTPGACREGGQVDALPDVDRETRLRTTALGQLPSVGFAISLCGILI